METKEQRLERQNKQHRQMVRDLKESVCRMWQRKVQKDAFYINYNNIVESVETL